MRFGGTLGQVFDKVTENVKKLEIKDADDFLRKIESDINHLPEDFKKAIRDTSDELKRLNINFNDALEKAIDFAKDSLAGLPTPEEFANSISIKLANEYKEENNSAELCSYTIGGLLFSIGAMMKISSGAAPNPYADYLIIYGSIAATWGCTEAYK